MKTILIVDDERRISDQYSRTLSMEGYSVLTSTNAIEAKKLLVERPIDLVLLDINMPVVDGIDLSELMESFHNDVKIIISSVYPVYEQKEKVPSAVDYFDKSEGLKSLVDKVNLHLSSAQPKS